jgi:hypothetical protein
MDDMYFKKYSDLEHIFECDAPEYGNKTKYVGHMIKKVNMKTYRGVEVYLHLS